MSLLPAEPEDWQTPFSPAHWLTELCNRYEAAWRGGQQPQLEQYLKDSSIPDGQQALASLMRLEMKWRNRRGDPLRFDDWIARFPGEETLIQMALQAHNHNDVHGTLCDGNLVTTGDDPPPRQLLRYRITGTLGKGGFGVVYAAFDDELRRPVAIKVLHRKWLTDSNYMERYLVEARALAKLDHPNIVPIYDVGRTDDGRLLMVAKYIEAGSLANRMRIERLSFGQSARIVALVADALHHAHLRGLIHRDVKAGNILLDNGDAAYVADFGLVLREEEFGTGPTFAGTPDYMSPEQARGEGHRVDGRSDVFSLGIVFYELLTGRRPFRAQSRDDLLEQIVNVDARPPRQVDDHIPKELERICLKALAKSAGQRYSTALDMANELREFLLRQSTSSPVVATAPITPALDSATRGSVKVVPKGLRSFDAADADFFLELLPGPRNRDGVPESVRFWQRRIGETDADQTIQVGLIYGPSGCGKSSLVKAGLLPRLPVHVRSIYIEAVDQATEANLLARLKKLCPTIPASMGLADFLTQLRRGRGLPLGEKLVIILDQFEQWLQSRRSDADQELIRALRQCDGGRVQCLILVRDDFWMAISRLMRDIEIPILEGENASAVDLFDLRHASGVLSMLGRAHGVLPDRTTEQSNDQTRFLEQAVHGLAQDDKIIPVRLALFSEMVKTRPWIPATLKAIGGIEGVGVAFLEESFAAATAPPVRRMHAAAARAVLKAMLPQLGKEIKGTMQSYAELLAVSGYADRPAEFAELIRILHRDLRLISPSDAEGAALDSTERRAAPSGHQYYQLTHDYVVPALRDWLTRKQRETARGRAELRLAECAARYQSKPVKRSLPSFLEWINIRLLTRRQDWTPTQRNIMHRAARRHGMRTMTAALAGYVIWWVGWHFHGLQKAQALHDRLLSASIDEVPRTIEAMRPYRPQVDGLLAATLQEAIAQDDSTRRLKVSMALLPTDSNQKDFLWDQLLLAPASDVRVIIGVLRPYLAGLAPRIRQRIDQAETTNGGRLRAACALAAFAPGDSRWPALREKLVSQLLIEKPDDTLLHWQPALNPVATVMTPHIAALMIEDGVDETQRRLLLRLYQAFVDNRSQPLEDLESQVAAIVPDRLPLVDLRRRANCGAALVAFGQPAQVWPRLAHSPNPTLRSLLIERMAPFAVPIGDLFNHLRSESNDSIRQALILALGNYRYEQIPLPDRDRFINHLVHLFDRDPNGGIHSAAEWTLRQWRCHERMAPIVRRLSTNRVEDNRRWFINSDGQTFVIIRGPIEFEFGPKHCRRTVQIAHSFAVATKEVTVAEFQRALPMHAYSTLVAATPDCPAIQVSWYDAAAYCNWLTAKEGGQPIFRPNADMKLNDNMTIDAEYASRSAYRLPTEIEWEFAAWAGAKTEWACGRADPELIRKYGWTWPFTIEGTGVRVHDVGTLKPNELGLFDVHGNVTEWCLDKALPEKLVGPPTLAELDDLVVEASIGRVGRGESSYDNPPTHDYYRRFNMVPSFDVHQFGLRLVRSVPPAK